MRKSARHSRVDMFMVDMEPLAKQSRQATPDTKGLNIVEPRHKWKDLLYFLDVNTWHRRCVYLKAAITGALGWQLITDNENKDIDEDHRAIQALLHTPNARGQTFSLLLYHLLIDYYALGNGWLEVVRNNRGQVSEIYHIPARTMRCKADSTGYWQVRSFKKVEFAAWGNERGSINEALHLKNYDPMDDYYGVPEWLPAMATMGLDRECVEYNTYSFRNGMTARFIIVVEGGELTRKARSALKKFIQSNMTGIKNAGRTIVISSDDPNVKIRIERINKDANLKDLSFTQSRQYSRDEIVSAHGVPPRMLGIMSAGQLGGAGEIKGQMQVFRDIIIAPEQRRLEQLINSTILASFGKHKWRLKLNEIDITDPQADAEYYAKLLNLPDPVLDVEEVRSELGYPPRPQRTERSEPVLWEGIARSLEGIRQVLEKTEPL